MTTPTIRMSDSLTALTKPGRRMRATAHFLRAPGSHHELFALFDRKEAADAAVQDLSSGGRAGGQHRGVAG